MPIRLIESAQNWNWPVETTETPMSHIREMLSIFFQRSSRLFEHLVKILWFRCFSIILLINRPDSSFAKLVEPCWSRNYVNGSLKTEFFYRKKIVKVSEACGHENFVFGIHREFTENSPRIHLKFTEDLSRAHWKATKMLKQNSNSRWNRYSLTRSICKMDARREKFISMFR